MVELTDSLKCLFTGTVEERGDEHVVTVPATEIEHGTIEAGASYRVALIKREGEDGASVATDGAADRAVAGNGAGRSQASTSSRPTSDAGASGPPVSEGDVREVTIETLGDKGDGIAKIERGYVVIVPDSEPGDEPTVEITSVRENVSFAEVVEE
ncbi:deoxyribonuclease/rho motif-related TRAM [Halorubrum saccharovorum DSM 1137]|uniref:Deoxyribonuclease/rho motif-related TRAM n=1 Tax=Halorubrum saccharovorum DSM 1137 TaxID=1227484 RepID=M0E9B6_9EURY|nr:TRAM domain-containing protein [Halorubrum saccharovorum]ELZ43638.1 deoxyribonuclease/rho motif-related TRAM [Halorubrum saccharovorum DSM 1137]